MPIEIADAIGRLAIAGPPQVLLHRHRGGTVGLLAHDGLVSHHAGRRKGLGGRTGHAEQGAEDGIAEAHGDFAHAASAVGIPTRELLLLSALVMHGGDGAMARRC